jgi:hypothetical protein
MKILLMTVLMFTASHGMAEGFSLTDEVRQATIEQNYSHREVLRALNEDLPEELELKNLTRATDEGLKIKIVKVN